MNSVTLISCNYFFGGSTDVLQFARTCSRHGRRIQYSRYTHIIYVYTIYVNNGVERDLGSNRLSPCRRRRRRGSGYFFPVRPSFARRVCVS